MRAYAICSSKLRRYVMFNKRLFALGIGIATLLVPSLTQAQTLSPGERAQAQNLANCLRLSASVPDFGPVHASGSRITFRCALVNATPYSLPVPLKRSRGRYLHDVGELQTWVERVGRDWKIPALPKSIRKSRKGRLYPAGSSNVPTYGTIEAYQTLGHITQLDTAGFPPGLYRYYVTFGVDEKRPTQTTVVEFLLR